MRRLDLVNFASSFATLDIPSRGIGTTCCGSLQWVGMLREDREEKEYALHQSFV